MSAPDDRPPDEGGQVPDTALSEAQRARLHSQLLDATYSFEDVVRLWATRAIELPQFELEVERSTKIAGWSDLCSHPTRIVDAALAEARAKRKADETVAEANNEPDPFDLTDVGSGRRFSVVCKERAKYDPARGWMIYDRNRGVWEPDDLRAEHLAKTEIPRALLREAASAEDREDRKARIKRAFATAARSGVRATLEMARSEPALAACTDDFDADPDLANAADCVIDLRSGDRLPHSPEHMMTRQLGVAYDPDAQAPIWAAHLERVTDEREGLQTFLERWWGYSLTGHTIEQCLVILYGSGANGKSKTVEAVRAALGDYAKHADAATFMATHNDSTASTGLARLAGARMVTVIETEIKGRLQESLVKQVTGDEPVTARFLFHDFFEFTPHFKLTFGTNHRPTIHGTDHGIWRRIRLVPFDVTIPDAEQDPHLGEKLLGELPGILAWMVSGATAWRVLGLGMPEEIRAATASYQLDMDPIATFMGECTVEDANATVAASELHKAYAAWAEKTGEKPVSQRAFSTRLKERGIVTDGRDPLSRRLLYHGFRVDETSDGDE